jgi:diguanylate cyclase (GGDEF)-like protein
VEEPVPPGAPVVARAPGSDAAASIAGANARRGARQGGWLLFGAGTITLVNNFIPPLAQLNRGLLFALGGLSLAISLTVLLLPWQRWHPRWSLSLAVVSMGFVTVADFAGGVSPYSYAIYFVVIFAWIGLAHGRWWPCSLAPLGIAAYLAPAIAHGNSRAISSIFVAMPVCVMLGELIAATVDSATRSRIESAGRADLLAALSHAARTINTLESDRILHGVIDTIVDVLDFDSATLVVFDHDSYSLTQTRGLESLPFRSFPATNSWPARVRDEQSTIVTDDYAAEPTANPVVAQLGMHAAIASPVWIAGSIGAALVASRRSRRPVSVDEIEAIDLLAGMAGRALENAQRYEEERDARQALLQESLRDELTGVGNRRTAEVLLRQVNPGDVVVLIDLDHFKDVNDTQGHEAGDEVLAELGSLLTGTLRPVDVAARWGGEEFLVVLRSARNVAPDMLDMLLDLWHARRPRTTFSIGAAVQEPGLDPSVTMRYADTALYAAKRRGRDRAVMWSPDLLEIPDQRAAVVARLSR